MNFFKHLFTITRHRHKVMNICFKIGIGFQGLFHDLSKYSPSEFFSGVKYYQGNRSPNAKEREVNGYSKAWLHHKGRNPHHYEYWQDNFDNGGHPVKMPEKYAFEMFCDYIGAARAYQGKNFSFQKELEWWNKKKSSNIAMHPQTKDFIDEMMKACVIYDEQVINKDCMRLIFNYTIIKPSFYEMNKGV